MDLSERTLRLENVRDGVSFEVRPRRVTALFGSDDASNLLTVALGLVRPEQGRVTVDGVDLDDLDPSAWWSEVAWVPRRPALVAGSIAENIRMGWSATDAEVADAARAAGLDGTLDAVVGEDTRADDRRQRIGLARVFLRNSAVVLLDEPTAMLDADGEEALAVLRRLVAGRTVLLAVHRPALLAIADVVIAVPALVPA
ncbi:ATP-binding cassette domain-containing protein [Cryptosporangium arvum]|uniref:ATP-binding cassette domain-containing protein n=1 Tax=Cryptosporangium arvum TaxID=80871 RepID=UPI0004B42A72|nr:ATP-binding cassette domain-containing protein [Cryptosporangium arvum]